MAKSKTSAGDRETRAVTSRTVRNPARGLRIRRRSLHEEVIERVRDMIIEGVVKPGERLNETMLADALGVSRTPIREALKLLASDGMLELLPNRGARVVLMSPTEIGELFEVISGLERHAAELAAKRMTAEDFDKLQQVHDRMEQHYKNRNRRDYSKLNTDVHMMIVAMSGNETLADMHRSLMMRARRVRYAALEVEERWREAFEEHVALMDALAKKDSRRAGMIMLAHSRETGETALNSYIEQNKHAPEGEMVKAS
jgi:DNA-binding GntR family transcriptional regulator